MPNPGDPSVGIQALDDEFPGEGSASSREKSQRMFRGSGGSQTEGNAKQSMDIVMLERDMLGLFFCSVPF